MTNPDPRLVRAAICDNGSVDVVEMDGEPGVSACIGCAGCAPHRYVTPAKAAELRAARRAADRAWIAAQAARVRRQRAVAPMRFRAS